MKKIFFCILNLLALFTLSQCNADHNSAYTNKTQGNYSDEMSAESSISYGIQESKSTSASTLPADKKIIRTGSISLESDDLAKSKNQTVQLVILKKGYIESEDAHAGDNYNSISLTIRVPATDFEDFVALLEKGEEKIVSKSIQANDVTAQYVDVESRLKTKRIYLARYQQLALSAKSIKDLLEIEEQIRTIQEEIDSYESTFKVLNNQVSYSTLNVTFSNQQEGISSAPSFRMQLKQAFADSWDVLTGFLFGIIRFWPVFALAILLVFVIRKMRKRSIFRRSKRSTEQ